jgi:hypothetical protein
MQKCLKCGFLTQRMDYSSAYGANCPNCGGVFVAYHEQSQPDGGLSKRPISHDHGLSKRPISYEYVGSQFEQKGSQSSKLFNIVPKNPFSQCKVEMFSDKISTTSLLSTDYHTQLIFPLIGIYLLSTWFMYLLYSEKVDLIVRLFWTASVACICVFMTIAIYMCFNCPDRFEISHRIYMRALKHRLNRSWQNACCHHYLVILTSDAVKFTHTGYYHTYDHNVHTDDSNLHIAANTNTVNCEYIGKCIANNVCYTHRHDLIHPISTIYKVDFEVPYTCMSFDGFDSVIEYYDEVSSYGESHMQVDNSKSVDKFVGAGAGFLIGGLWGAILGAIVSGGGKKESISSHSRVKVRTKSLRKIVNNSRTVITYIDGKTRRTYVFDAAFYTFLSSNLFLLQRPL